MNCTITGDGTFSLESERVSLLRARPVLNGAPLEGWQAVSEVGEAGALTVRYNAPGLHGAALVADLSPPDEAGISWLRTSLEGAGDPTAFDSFGLQFEAVENLRAYLRCGYNSWDGSFYVEPEGLADFEPYEDRPETGFALTQLLPRYASGCVVVGFDRHDRFQQTFTFDTRQNPPALTILTWWDRKTLRLADGGRCQGERLAIFEHAEVEGGLREWARLVAAAAPQPPRLSAPPITGWCSWYNLYAKLSEENILEHLRAAVEVGQRESLPMRVFQIDDGFTPEMGDWLEVKPQFPHGMRPVLDEIRSAGFLPGLWIGPFIIGNRSRLYHDHPDWVLKDRASGLPLVQWQLYGEFRWHKRSEEYYVLDPTHPQAFAYLRQVFHTWRWEWGCEYFKTDFMLWFTQHGPQEAVYHTPGVTRIEAWRQVAEMIREEIGDAVWLGCGCPLWASVGLVDAIRIGGDVGVTWEGGISAQSLLRDQAARNFANHILWQIDPDCILLRERYHHLSESEVRSLAIYAGMSGGVIMTSDHLGELGPERLRLWRLLLNEQRTTADFPLLGQTPIIYERQPDPQQPRRIRHLPRAVDPVLVQVRTPAQPGGPAAVFIFNTGDVPVQRTYALETLGLAGPLYVHDWTAGQSWPVAAERLPVNLAPHDGILLFLSQAAFEATPLHLP